jgi:hypothetical protein
MSDALPGNRLREFFYNRTSGPGIWKWDHYFEIYERHFAKFRGTPVHILEIGVFSGGSLDMWRDYFGPEARIYGVDIQPECKVYERDGVEIHIGDQSDPMFWDGFKRAVPDLDIVIDDGSHKPRHQTTTLNQLLPHLRPGGVFLCEDIHGYPESPFADYAHKMAHGLNDHRGFEKHPDDNDRRLVLRTSEFQATINSVHLYPYVVVFEKNEQPVGEFVAPKRGDQWQPFRA